MRAQSINLNYYQNQTNKKTHQDNAFGKKVSIKGLVTTICAKYSPFTAVNKVNKANVIGRAVTGVDSNKYGCLLVPDHVVHRLTMEDRNEIRSAVALVNRLAKKFFGKDAHIKRTPQQTEEFITEAVEVFKAKLGFGKKCRRLSVINPPEGGRILIILDKIRHLEE